MAIERVFDGVQAIATSIMMLLKFHSLVLCRLLPVITYGKSHAFIRSPPFSKLLIVYETRQSGDERNLQQRLAADVTYAN